MSRVFASISVRVIGLEGNSILYFLVRKEDSLLVYTCIAPEQFACCIVCKNNAKLPMIYILGFLMVLMKEKPAARQNREPTLLKKFLLNRHAEGFLFEWLSSGKSSRNVQDFTVFF